MSKLFIVTFCLYSFEQCPEFEESGSEYSGLYATVTTMAAVTVSVC